jgi:integrase/recombinase XerD
MAIGRQAQTLEKRQLARLLEHVDRGRTAARDRVIVLLSYKAGLRAIEIGGVRWRMVTTAAGAIADLLALENEATKGGRSGRAIPLAGELREALDTLRFWAINTGTFRGDAFVCRFRKGSSDRATRADTVRKLFERWYRALGFHGCSSHSGRRTFATRGLRHLGKTGASSRDLQQLTGHKRLATLEGYVDGSRKAQRKLVEFA